MSEENFEKKKNERNAKIIRDGGYIRDFSGHTGWAARWVSLDPGGRPERNARIGISSAVVVPTRLPAKPQPRS